MSRLRNPLLCRNYTLYNWIIVSLPFALRALLWFALRTCHHTVSSGPWCWGREAPSRWSSCLLSNWLSTFHPEFIDLWKSLIAPILIQDLQDFWLVGQLSLLSSRIFLYFYCDLLLILLSLASHLCIEDSQVYISKISLPQLWRQNVCFRAYFHVLFKNKFRVTVHFALIHT